MFFSSAISAILVTHVFAQRPNDGISKQTYAGNDPIAFINWVTRYLPAHCGDAVALCNNSGGCGQKGRLNLCPENDACTGGPFDSLMFHMVNTSARPSGPTTVAQVEATFDEKMAAAFQARRYDSFMDLALVLWASDLDVYLQKFAADGVLVLPLKWQSSPGNDKYSVIFHVPRTQVVIELVSTAQPQTVTEFVEDPTVRYTEDVFSNMGATTEISSKYVRPLAISKATSDMDKLVDFYENALFATATHKQSYQDGTNITIFNVGFSKMSGKMSVRFVSRPPSMTTSSMSVKQLEEIKFAGHDWVHDNSGNLTANCICGFDKWYDNHYAIDNGETSLDDYKAAFDKRSWPYYHAWGGGLGPENVYVVDPTGDSVQLDARWVGPAPPGVAGDALSTMCTQGDCKKAFPPTPTACASAIASMCPGLQYADALCSDCIYDVANHGKLKDVGCFNSDMVAYCVPEKNAETRVVV